jgi:hypothetical protein
MDRQILEDELREIEAYIESFRQDLSKQSRNKQLKKTLLELEASRTKIKVLLELKNYG